MKCACLQQELTVMDAAQKSSKIDMKHGFMKSIIRNQVDRDKYDKEVKASKPVGRGRHIGPLHHRSKKPDAAVYVPPSRKDTNTEEDWDTNGVSDNSVTDNNVPEPAVKDNIVLNHSSDEDDGMPKTLFRFEFEDKDGQVYKQYVMEGISASVLAQRMGYDRRLPANMIKALEERLTQEIDKRTRKS